jgi:asparagine synthase (glutamine-hydrolysing)
VVLTGEGGDELLAGYPRYRWLHWSDRMLRQPLAGAMATTVGPSVASLLPARHGSRLRAVLDGGSLADRHLRWVANIDQDLKREVLHPDVAALLDARAPEAHVASVMARSGSARPLTELMYADFKTWLPDNILTKMDRMSMAASVEGRVPLLDHKVVEFTATLPYTLKLSGRQTKRLLRAAVSGLLPPELIDRPKTAFRVPLDEWLRGPLATLVADTFTSSAARGRGLFDLAALDRVTMPRHGDGNGVSAQARWNLLWLELWCRQYLDANTAADR